MYTVRVWGERTGEVAGGLVRVVDRFQYSCTLGACLSLAVTEPVSLGQVQQYGKTKRSADGSRRLCRIPHPL